MSSEVKEAPANSEVVPLKIFIRPERRFVADGRPTELVVLVRLVPGIAKRELPQPVNLAVVLDHSVASDPELNASAKRGLSRLIDAMGPDDRLSVSVGGETVDTVISNRRVTDRSAMRRAVDTIQSRGTGDLYPAWFSAAWEAARRHRRGTLSRVVVLSADSVPLEQDNLKAAARGLFRRGVSTSAIGIGTGFTEDVLVPLTNESGGSCTYVLDAEHIGDRLVGELQSCRTLFSEWATLRFDLENAEVVDVLNDFDWAGDNKVDLPPLYGETPLNVVIRLRIRPGMVGSEITPLTVRVKNLDLERKQAVVHRKRMKLHVVSSNLADGMAPDIGVQAQAARLDFARMHRKCIAKIDAGDLEGARQLLDFSVARFQALSRQSGGTLLAEDLNEMMHMRQLLSMRDESTRNRKFFQFSAIYAQRSGFLRPTPPY